MLQHTLFCEDIYDAIKTDIQALGGNKSVGKMLWPEKDPIRAGDYLSTCLRPDRAEKLDIEQVMLISRLAREKGSYHTSYFFNDYTGFTRPHPIEPEDEAAKLQRMFIQSVELQRDIAEKMERLQPQLKAKRK